MPSFLKKRIAWVLLVGVVIALVIISFFRSPDNESSSGVTSFSGAVSAAQRGDVTKIYVHARYITILYEDARSQRAYIGRQTDVIAALQGSGVTIGQGSDSVPVEFVKTSSGSGTAFWIINLGLPIVALFVLYWAVRIGVRHGFEAYDRRRAETRD